MSGNLTEIKVNGLFNRKTYQISIRDNTLILVGENGMGKTTVLKIIYGILSGDLRHIRQIDFNDISATIDDKEYFFTHEEIGKSNKIPNSIFHELPSFIRREIGVDKEGELVDLDDISYACKRMGYPLQDIVNRYNLEDKHPNIKYIKQAMNAQILYLPTYRRIEDDISYIMRGKNNNDNYERNRYMYGEYKDEPDNIEIIEFGMQDVKEKIEMKSLELRQYSEKRFRDLTYMNLGDVVDRKYDIEDENFRHVTEADINKFWLCTARSSSNVLSKEQCRKIISTITNIEQNNYDLNSKLLLYYFRKLIDLQKDLERKEQSIRDYCNVCENYLYNKSVVYDDSTFEVKVINGDIRNIEKRKIDKNIIDIGHLSSGEKQILSLFSQLYLSKRKKFFVIIDEPELSLSVPWQKTFLEDIRNSNLCTGLISATHSPFIYDNSLLKYAHGLGEYLLKDEIL